MARSHAAATNGGWQTQGPPTEPEQRSGRFVPISQRPAQAGMQNPQATGYPQAGYPEQQAPNPAYDPQGAYHYPQQQAAAPSGPRPGLSSLETASQPGAEYPTYPNTRPPQGQGQPQARYAPAGPDPVAQAGAGYGQAGAPYPGQPRQPDVMADLRAAAAGYEQWQGAPPQDPRGYDLGSYMPNGLRPDAGSHPGSPMHPGDPLQPQPEWVLPHGGYGDPDQAYQAGLGYEQHAGALDQPYAPEESGEYEPDEPRRGSWVLRIAGAIVVAVGLGYGLAQGYKLMLGTAHDGATPVVKGDGAPAKVKPAEPGGKQFAHTDSKIMDRLGPAGGSSQSAPSADVDSNGARKVTTLVVGRDGSIVPPQAPAEPAAAQGTVAVPGVTVFDGFGGQFPGTGAPSSNAAPDKAPNTPPPAAAGSPIVVTPPPQGEKPKVVAKAATPAAGAATPPPQKSSAAAKKPAAAPARHAAANGYVAVLASIPASSQSRLIALKKFADMQQQYGTMLQNKTPDVKEANLGAKGIYHRLLVGPPGSRSQASGLCNELKAAGYKDCWVTAY